VGNLASPREFERLMKEVGVDGFLLLIRTLPQDELYRFLGTVRHAGPVVIEPLETAYRSLDWASDESWRKAVVRSALELITGKRYD
jgi:hypothetical protein